MKVVNKKGHVPTANDVYIGRPSVLGNPFSHKKGTKALWVVPSAEIAVKMYAQWLKDKIDSNDTEIIQALSELKADSVLVCWCKNPDGSGWCHGDVLIRAYEFCKKKGIF